MHNVRKFDFQANLCEAFAEDKEQHCFGDSFWMGSLAKDFFQSLVNSRPATRGGEAPPRTIFDPPWKTCVGRSLNLSDIVQKFWAPLSKLLAP